MEPTVLTDKKTNQDELIRQQAELLRILDLKALQKGGSGHPGGTLSLADVMSTLYFGGVLRYDPQDPSWSFRDRLVLSEGHSVPILYSAFVAAGFKGWSEAALMDLRKNPDVIAQGHATRVSTPGIDCSTGALGMGGSKALGMALAARYNGYDYHTFAIIGDGEAEEGQVYEAAANAGLLGIDNLTWILNRNKAQQTAGIHALSGVQYDDFFRSLSWNVVVLNGESSDPVKNRTFITELRQALLKAKNDAGRAGKPTIIIADTIKGKGVDFMEYRGHAPLEYKFHGVAPTEDELKRALAIIQTRLESMDTGALQTFRTASAVTAQAKKQIDQDNTKRHAERLEQLKQIRSKASASFPAYALTDKPVGTREGFGKALAFLAKEHTEIVATSPDLQDSVQMGTFEKVTGRHARENATGAYFPEGISECNAAGKAAGLGIEGLIPFIGTFDNFLLEAADELQHASAFGSFYVAVGTHSGCGVGPDGKSQMGVACPGMIDHFSGIEGELFDMYEPADAQEAADVTRLIVEQALATPAADRRKPVYLRLTRHNVAHINRSAIANYPAQLKEGSYEVPVNGQAPSTKPDLILVGSGATVPECIKAAEALSKEGVTVNVINVVRINRIAKSDSAFVRTLLRDNAPILTVHDAEPHALGHRVKDAVNAARLAGRQPGVVKATLGVNISPLSAHVGSGTSEENYRRNQLDAAGILLEAKKILKK